MKIAKLFFLGLFLLMACSDNPPNESNKVTIKLTNNTFSPTETSDLYKKQDVQILDINKCKGSPTTGDAQTCTAGTSVFNTYYVTAIPFEGDKLPDSTVLNGFDAGFYWASFLFYRNDPDNGCMISEANGVFEIKENKNVKSTLELGIPHSCYYSPCNEGQTACDGLCVELNTDNDNCGACGNACTGGDSCTAGVCGP